MGRGVKLRPSTSVHDERMQIMTKSPPINALLVELAKVTRWNRGWQFDVPMTLAELKAFIPKIFEPADAERVLEILDYSVEYIMEIASVALSEIEDHGEFYTPVVEEFMADLIVEYLKVE